ncbi:alpha/beta hydrolase [Streptomyces neyagawaensis]|uniref:alpha/beta hydrolase n=1 Tax=Streptomyces neyagawaensis TaxID=42238 RepID=UPI0006E44908|nr:alpha/beta hydrolase [Streptomyces neyagawaensis]MCL6735889.1 alpha/beta hydrolase [Streptomyces neyagawaensis]MDE1686307.1 alpha/beta hydrolase [Streptomyces neyagawaensis]
MVVTAAIWMLFVAIAGWPPVRRGTLGFAVFVLTMTVNEIPLILLGVFVVSMVMTDHPVGMPATVAAAVCAAMVVGGLVWLQLRASSARAVLEAELERGLGIDWRASVGPADTSAAGRLAGHWWRGILLPFQRRSHAVERSRNLRYGPDRAHRVDLYRTPSSSCGRPVLVHLHGGGFFQGGKSREGVMMLNRLAAHGWLCLSANYRLRSAGRHPNPLVDTKRLIAWIRDNAREHGADPTQVFIAGSSAGGHLAVSAALTSDRVALQPGFEAADTSVAGVVVLYGYLGARTADPSSSPALLARPDAPPMLIVHGANDTAVPPASAQAVAAALRQVSRRPVVFVELPYTQHDFDFFASVRSRVTADAIEAFLNWARTHDGD